MTIDYVEHVRSASDALVAAASSVPLDTLVPTCPGWTVADLLDHVGRTHRWAAANIRSGERVTFREIDGPGDEGPLAFARNAADDLVAALRATDPTLPGWHFAATEQVRGFWFRRQAVETLVHRVDAERAAGVETPIDPSLAADGIDEALDVIATRMLAGRDGVDLGGSVHVHCTDVEGEWTFRTDDGVYQLHRGHAKGDAALRGPAASILLVLWQRLPADDASLERFGDTDLVDRWLALRPTP